MLMKEVRGQRLTLGGVRGWTGNEVYHIEVQWCGLYSLSFLPQRAHHTPTIGLIPPLIAYKPSPLKQQQTLFPNTLSHCNRNAVHRQATPRRHTPTDTGAHRHQGQLPLRGSQSPSEQHVSSHQ